MMIRFSHEANSWMLKASFTYQTWIQIDPEQVRWYVDNHFKILLD